MTISIKTIRLVLVISALSGMSTWCARAAATPGREQGQTNDPTPTAAIPNTDDIEAVVLHFAATGPQTGSSLEKSEFETTAQFEARTKQERPVGRKYAFVYGSYGSSGSSSRFVPEYQIPALTDRLPPSFTYNADEGVMGTSISESTPTMRVVVRSADLETGQNSYGATTEFLSILCDEFAIVPSKASISWLNGELWREYRFLKSAKFSFPLTIEQAREIKPHLRIVLVGTVPDTWMDCEDSRKPATMNGPVERRVHRCEINFDIAEVRIVDDRTGMEVTTFTSTYGPHRTGETFREWLSATSLGKVCQTTPKTDVCKTLAVIKKAGHGEFDAVDDSQREVGWIFIDGKLAQIRSRPYRQ